MPEPRGVGALRRPGRPPVACERLRRVDALGGLQGADDARQERCEGLAAGGGPG